FLNIAGMSAASAVACSFATSTLDASEQEASKPNVILVMTDDQGWGDVAYNGHPTLKTPNLDAMAASGIRFDRFYSAAPVCTPTRASVMTGRNPNRYHCPRVGYPLRKQELTLAQIMKQNGYATGHFGKWHLDGTGDNKPILQDNPLNPGVFGFDRWSSSSNFFDIDGKLGRNGKPFKLEGDSSVATVKESLEFLKECVKDKKPFFSVVWFGSPHIPHRAADEDKKLYENCTEEQKNYFGEISGIDRAVGIIRTELRNMNIADNTILWFCSDNGGDFDKDSVGNLKGGKASLHEGGIRVPGIIEWPSLINKPRTTAMPAFTSDIMPTVLEAVNAKVPSPVLPLDGISLMPLISGKTEKRDKLMFFWYGEQYAVMDDAYKLYLSTKKGNESPSLYDIVNDPKETKDISAEKKEITQEFKQKLDEWVASVKLSQEGKDYPEGKLTSPDFEPKKKGKKANKKE
ncbi:MAG TPA: sulfatase-like hydrolase/transferase, partial [Victivallales bacterium]|nr:sulfatase-like hydrolase/transferase [Victivallales bacterium]